MTKCIKLLIGERTETCYKVTGEQWLWAYGAETRLRHLDSVAESAEDGFCWPWWAGLLREELEPRMGAALAIEEGD